MSMWITIELIAGAALLFDLFFTLHNLAHHQGGLVLNFYNEAVALHSGASRRPPQAPAAVGRRVQAWLRTPHGFFGMLAALGSVLLTPAAFLLTISHGSNDVPWGIFGLSCLGVLYFLTGLRASAAAGTLRAGLIAGALLASVSTAVMVLVTPLSGDTWEIGPWSSVEPSLIGYLAFSVVLFGFFGLPGLALSACGAAAGKMWRHKETARAAKGRGQRRHRT